MTPLKRPYSLPQGGLHEVAATWIVREDEGRLGADGAAALEAWLAENPRHRQAYAAARYACDVAARHAADPPMMDLRAAALAAEVAALAPEVELDHRPRGQLPRMPPGQRGAQEAGFEDRQAGPEAELRAQTELEADVVERVRVDDAAGGEAVVAEAADGAEAIVGASRIEGL